jgi:integrase
MLYNKEQKLRFMEQYDQDTQDVYSYIFKSCYRIERRFNKDVCQFSHEQFKTLLENFRSTSLQSLKVRTSRLRTYIDYCISNGLAVDQDGKAVQVNVADIFDTSALEKFVRADAIRKKYLIGEEMDNFIDFCYNAQDAVVVQLLRQGVKGKDLYEIRNLSKQDIDFLDRILTLHDNDGSVRKHKVDEKTMGLIMEALGQTHYVAKNGTTDRERVLIQGDYVVRPLDYPNISCPISTAGIQGRLSRIAKMYGNAFITPHTLFVSGQIEYAKMLKERDGVEELTLDHYKEICSRFGLTTNDASAYSVKYSIQKYI